MQYESNEQAMAQIDLPGKYLHELENIQEELTKRQNPEDIVSKDSDNN